MDGPGIVELVHLAAVLAFALPIAGFGVTLVLDGRPLGLVFVGIAAMMLVLHQAITNPFSPEDVVETAVDRIAIDDES